MADSKAEHKIAVAIEAATFEANRLANALTLAIYGSRVDGLPLKDDDDEDAYSALRMLADMVSEATKKCYHLSLPDKVRDARL